MQARVSEAQLELLLGIGRDPGTGAPLGRAYTGCAASAPGSDRAVEKASAPTRRRAVAGCDFTLSLPMSAWVL